MPVNIWKRITCAMDDVPDVVEAAFAEWMRLTEKKMWHRSDVWCIANRVALGNDAHSAAMRQYSYDLTRAVARGVWGGHLIGL